ncbi:MAG: hypothetical protein BGO25_18140 [Acidobacteriales bacterium 59-55]|nr:hypothetical protein [Terriglobales bacterium]OJV41596.1 MAG: hypothetical protein BGO25_18140 [Acidobacteriales bacterium 59-55]
MPNLTEIIKEVSAIGTGHDVVRRKYMRELSQLTDRNLVIYYSGWLQKRGLPGLDQYMALDDNDKNGFMAAFHDLDKSKGLDIVLHTPGGDIAATESIVHYIHQIFGSNVRAIVPQLAMSAGTMISLSCSEILMGKHSNLGPIDPQVGFLPAHGILEEFQRATDEISSAQNQQELQGKLAVWQPIVAKYNPTLIGQCQKAITWSNEMVKRWLCDGMFKGEENADEKAEAIVQGLGSHALTKNHARHIHTDKLLELGIKIKFIEGDQKLQDAILSLHHSCINALSHTQAVKIIENQNGVGLSLAVQVMNQANNQSAQATGQTPLQQTTPSPDALDS